MESHELLWLLIFFVVVVFAVFLCRFFGEEAWFAGWMPACAHTHKHTTSVTRIYVSQYIWATTKSWQVYLLHRILWILKRFSWSARFLMSFQFARHAGNHKLLWICFRCITTSWYILMCAEMKIVTIPDISRVPVRLWCTFIGIIMCAVCARYIYICVCYIQQKSEEWIVGNAISRTRRSIYDN